MIYNTISTSTHGKSIFIRKKIFYKGTDVNFIDTLKYDSNFENSLRDILSQIELSIDLELVVTGSGKPAEVQEGISLVSYDRHSVRIAYCEPNIPRLGTAYINIGCPWKVGAAEELFKKLSEAGVPGGEVGCTAEPTQIFITRRHLSAGPCNDYFEKPMTVDDKDIKLFPPKKVKQP